MEFDSAVDVLDFFSLDNAMPLLLIVGVLEFLGGKIGDACGALHFWDRANAIAAFFLYAALAGVAFQPDSPEAMLAVGLRALLAMAVAHGLSAAASPIVGVVWRHAVLRPREARRRAAAARLHAAVLAAERTRLAQRQVADEQDAARRAEALAQENRLAELRTETEARDRDRRDQARLACEMEFAKFIPQIQRHLPRKRLDQFIAKYMSDAVPVSEVETRSLELLTLVRLHAGRCDGDRKHSTFADLACWAAEQRASIESLATTDKAKRTYLSELAMRHDELVEELMRRSGP